MTPNATSTPDASAPEPNAISTLLSAPADRRTFLARASVLTLAIPGVGAALAACGPASGSGAPDSVKVSGAAPAGVAAGGSPELGQPSRHRGAQKRETRHNVGHARCTAGRRQRRVQAVRSGAPTARACLCRSHRDGLRTGHPGRASPEAQRHAHSCRADRVREGNVSAAEGRRGLV